MTRTIEQQTIINHIKAAEGLTRVSSVAGSGKTTLLIELAKELKPVSGIYLAYTKSVATEANGKFPREVQCCTTHALAYAATIANKSLGLKLGTFNYRNIDGLDNYEDRLYATDLIKRYCLSEYVHFRDFVATIEAEPLVIEACYNALELMQNGNLDCSHEFYLKLFHIFLAKGDITYPTLDLLLLDEAGDINPVTYAIFLLLPAKRKVMVGDPLQNIFAFNHTINCFALAIENSTVFPMTKSFRVASEIASRIERYCQFYLDPSMKFEGVKLTDKTIKTRAYISRSNATLINKMLELNRIGVQYGLTRTAKQIFELPLSLCGLKYRGFIADQSLRFLQTHVDEYFEDEALKQRYRSPLMYIKALHEHDVVISQTINTIIKYGAKAIISCYEEARKHEKSRQVYMLGTAHSTKGLEFDEVELADDLNLIVEPIIERLNANPSHFDYLTTSERTELNLYYVAASRARKSLLNAKHL